MDHPQRRYVRLDQGEGRQRRVRDAHDPRNKEAHHLRAGARIHGRSHEGLQLHPRGLQQGNPQANR